VYVIFDKISESHVVGLGRI